MPWGFLDKPSGKAERQIPKIKSSCISKLPPALSVQSGEHAGDVLPGEGIGLHLVGKLL